MKIISMRSYIRLFAALVFLSLPIFAGADEWRKIGYGTLEDGAKFDVYVDTDSIIEIGDKVRFWQGHVFYKEQPLPSGGRYMRVSIERVVDCAGNSDSNVQAIFYGRDGSVVYNYKDDIQLEPLGPDTIRQSVRQFVCAYRKN